MGDLGLMNTVAVIHARDSKFPGPHGKVKKSDIYISIYDNSVIPTFTTRHSQKNECHLEVPLTLLFLHWCGLSYSYEFGFSPPS